MPQEHLTKGHIFSAKLFKRVYTLGCIPTANLLHERKTKRKKTTTTSIAAVITQSVPNKFHFLCIHNLHRKHSCKTELTIFVFYDMILLYLELLMYFVFKSYHLIDARDRLEMA